MVKFTDDMKPTTYNELYVLREKEGGKLVLYYWSSSQKHKALFDSYKRADEARKWIESETIIEKIV